MITLIQEQKKMFTSGSTSLKANSSSYRLCHNSCYWTIIKLIHSTQLFTLSLTRFQKFKCTTWLLRSSRYFIKHWELNMLVKYLLHQSFWNLVTLNTPNYMMIFKRALKIIKDALFQKCIDFMTSWLTFCEIKREKNKRKSIKRSWRQKGNVELVVLYFWFWLSSLVVL